jgi:hypothetical protein
MIYIRVAFSLATYLLELDDQNNLLKEKMLQVPMNNLHIILAPIS